MNILWVAPGRLLPVAGGASIRTINTIRELRARHNVHMLSLYSGRPDLRYESVFRAEFPDGEVMCLGNSLRGALAYRLPGFLTFALSHQLSPNRRARNRIETLLATGDFDVAVCDFVFAAAHFPEHLPVPAVLHQHNVEWSCLASQAGQHSKWLSPISGWLVRRLKRFEAKQVGRFSHTIAVSEDDARLFRQLAPGAAVSSISTAVDQQEFHAAPLPASAEPLVVYTGVMSYPPNVDAVRWFCSEIWPRVLAAVPNARFRIVGRDPARAVQALASGTVEVTGRVNSVAAHLREASVVAVPLRSGGGTRLKVYEAMATGRPIVSTSFGPAGLDVQDGHDIVLADRPEDFAREVVALLTDRERAAHIGANAAETVAQYTWAKVAQELEAVFNVVAEATPSASRR